MLLLQIDFREALCLVGMEHSKYLQFKLFEFNNVKSAKHSLFSLEERNNHKRIC